MAAPNPNTNLDRETESLKAFIDLLHREQGMLTHGETESLLPLVGEKNALAGELAGFARQREAALRELGLPGGRAGMSAWLERGGDARQRQAWDAMLALAGEARALNETNGRLIGLHMQHNQKALNALLGAADLAATYGPDGQQQSGVGGRSLGSA